MVSVAVIIAVAVNTDGVREILVVATGPSEAEPFWTDFLRGLTRRGLRGVKLVISDAHEGLKAAASKVLKTTWQRCRVHFKGLARADACRCLITLGAGPALLWRASTSLNRTLHLDSKLQYK